MTAGEADSGAPNRLEPALAAFVRFRGAGGAPDEFLAAHDDLRDLLEPMVVPEPFPETDQRTVLGGDYRLEREIGRGGAGVVYAAWQLSLGRRVAVKVLRHHVTLAPSTPRPPSAHSTTPCA